MVTVANPIYDIVFKYLMNDERIARTILSALLKMDIVRVEMRPHEYPDAQRDTLSVFRIDFGATIRKDDGTEQMILVELQKTWLETETLRFRQYLGVQYQSPKNVIGKGRDTHALPMVAIYLLGHKVGDIEEPVLYVRHHAFDYDGNVVTKGLPNPFVDSLTHDSVIVQIPRLHGQINTRLDKVLSIFDQSYISGESPQTLCLDDSLYAGDADMEHIVHQLLKACTDADVRQSMNVEDEYFSAIENRDTEIMMRDQKLAMQKVEIAEKDAQLTEKDAQLTEKDAQLNEKDAQLTEKVAQLNEKDAQLTEKDAQLTEQQSLLCASIKMMLKSNVPLEVIAENLGKDISELKQIIGQ